MSLNPQGAAAPDSFSSSSALPSAVAALVLAAGRGERMRPLTDHQPKPLLPVRGQPLMQWAMTALASGGFTRQVINTAWLGAQIEAHFGERTTLGGQTVHLSYSREAQDFGHALETAGGIARAMPALTAGGQDLFWVLAGDVFAPQFVFSAEQVARFAASDALAHIWLVPNPAHNPQGDFVLDAQGRVHDARANLPGELADLPSRTYSTVGLYRRALFEAPWCTVPAGNPQGVAAPLRDPLRLAMAQGRVTGELYGGDWTDVGTPERLAALNQTAPQG